MVPHGVQSLRARGVLYQGPVRSFFLYFWIFFVMDNNRDVDFHRWVYICYNKYEHVLLGLPLQCLKIYSGILFWWTTWCLETTTERRWVILAAGAVLQFNWLVVIIPVNVMLLTGFTERDTLPHHPDQARGTDQCKWQVWRKTEQSSTSSHITSVWIPPSTTVLWS